VYEQSQIVTRDLFDNIATAHQVDISSVTDVLDNMVESIGRTPDALLWLAKLKKSDGLAYNLALNVSVTLMAFNSFLGLSKEQIKTSGLAGLLQDIGKASLSTDVLLKKGKLTKEEYQYAQKHVDESLAILKATPDIPPSVIKLVAEHHERADGSGYPKQLKGAELNLLSQTAGLIDTYCALTNDRSYAQAAYHQQALEQIHALSGQQFTTELIDQLVQFMGIYPVSSLVELNTGEVGVVIQQNQVRRLLPRVMVLLDPKKIRYKAPIVLDLILKPASPNGDPYTITKGVPADAYGLNPSDFYV
jgi:HD-GYP domain-containing protein (c-di-GMP phosphodiesterase class II)